MNKLLKWFFFTVLLSVLPILSNLLYSASRNESFTIISFIGHGELLLISIALIASSTGELLSAKKEYYIFKIIAGGINIFLLLLLTQWYSMINPLLFAGSNINENFIATWSIIFFICIFITGGIAIFISEN